MRAHTRYLTKNTRQHRELVNITRDVADFCAESGIKDGFVLVSAMHVTSAVIVNDDEPGLHQDFDAWMQELAPEGPDYRHHRTGERNGDAHLKNLLLHHQVIVPVTVTSLTDWILVFMNLRFKLKIASLIQFL